MTLIMLSAYPYRSHHGDIPKGQDFESIKLHDEVDSICKTSQAKEPHLVSWEGALLVVDQGWDILQDNRISEQLCMAINKVDSSIQ